MLLLVTAHVKVCHLAYGDVCFVNLFRSILPVVPTECDVLILYAGNITTKSGSLTNSMQKCGKILPGRKDTLAPVVSTLWGRATPSPRRSDASEPCRGLLPPLRRPFHICGLTSFTLYCVHCTASYARCTILLIGKESVPRIVANNTINLSLKLQSALG